MCDELLPPPPRFFLLLLTSGYCKILIYFKYNVNWMGNELAEVVVACQNQPSLYAISAAS